MSVPIYQLVCVASRKQILSWFLSQYFSKSLCDWSASETTVLLFRNYIFTAVLLYVNLCSEGFLFGEKLAFISRMSLIVASANYQSGLFASFRFLASSEE